MQLAAAKDWSISNLRDDNTKVKKLLQLGFSALFFEQCSKPFMKSLVKNGIPIIMGSDIIPALLLGDFSDRKSIWSTPKKPPDNRQLHALKLTANGPESHNFHILRDDSGNLAGLAIFVIIFVFGECFSVFPLAGKLVFFVPSNPSNSKFNLQTNLTSQGLNHTKYHQNNGLCPKSPVLRDGTLPTPLISGWKNPSKKHFFKGQL